MVLKAIYTIRSLLHSQHAHIYTSYPLMNSVDGLLLALLLEIDHLVRRSSAIAFPCDTLTHTTDAISRLSAPFPASRASAPPPPSHSYNLALAPFHPASSATISAHLSPIASTVSIGFTLVISGNTPASAILTPSSPLNLKRQSTTAISSLAKSPILVVPAGW